VTPQSFGGQLRRLREQRRITLEQISLKSKVSVALLRSLEAGGCEGWPGGMYSRGYVRAYAAIRSRWSRRSPNAIPRSRPRPSP
jgi:cytoskeletal protein RodZ